MIVNPFLPWHYIFLMVSLFYIPADEVHLLQSALRTGSITKLIEVINSQTPIFQKVVGQLFLAKINEQCEELTITSGKLSSVMKQCSMHELTTGTLSTDIVVEMSKRYTMLITF